MGAKAGTINPAERALLASSRLVELAPGLPHGSHLTLVLAGDGDKRVSIEIHADTDASAERRRDRLRKPNHDQCDRREPGPGQEVPQELR